MTTPAAPNVAPSYLFDMPLEVLNGDARGIETWCREKDKMRPTLLHLCLARSARKADR